MKKLNKDIRKQIAIVVIAIAILMIAFAGICFLYFSDFYAIRVNGSVVLSRKILRYAMYAAFVATGYLAGQRIENAGRHLKKLLAIKKRKKEKR